jgi:hypothetical protein
MEIDMTENFSDESIKVVISGKAVYKAVKNYFNNTIKGDIAKEIDRYVQNTDINKLIEQAISAEIDKALTWRVKQQITREVEKALAGNLSDRLRISLTSETKIEHGK